MEKYKENINCENAIIEVEQTNNRIREEWEKLKMRGYNIPEGEKFGVCDDNTIWDRDDIADWWLSKIDELLKSQREADKKELVEKIEEFRQIEQDKKCNHEDPKNGVVCSESGFKLEVYDDILQLLSNLSPNKENKNNERNTKNYI